SICLYRVSPLHPLSRIPGPTIAKVTMLHHAYIVYQGHRHEYLKKLHERYGTIVRIGPDEISINDVSAVKSVLGRLPKGPFYTVRAPKEGGGSLITITGEAHAIRRRRWEKGLNPQSLKDYQESLNRRTNELLEHMSMRSAKPVDFAAWMNLFVIDFLGDMAFGGGINMMSHPNPEEDPFWPMLERYSRTMVTTCQLPWAYDFCTKLSFMSEDLLGVIKFGISKAKERVARGTKSKDLWYHLMNEAGVEQVDPPYIDTVRDGALAVIAGSDTSSALMCSLFFCLLSEPLHYRRVQEEIEKVALSETQVNEGGITQGVFPYVAACINEALRLYPPVPTSGPREVPMGSGGHLVSGTFIPEGSRIYVPPYVLQRNPLYFSDPDMFKPERWLGEPENRDAFIPFSYGFANCVAKNLALREMLTLTVSLLQRYDIRFAPGFDYREWPRGVHDYYITTRPPLLVVFTPR
ncbi:cytochrome P450, partial [Hymenopellis radicata]